MGDTRPYKLPVIPVILAALIVGFASPASASFTSLAPAAPTIAPATALSLTASVEPPASSLRVGLSPARTPPGPRPYFGARYYSAPVARFTTVDPVYTWRENLLDPQRWNRYAYARNNPLRYVDPNGEQVAGAVRQWGQQVQTWPDQRAVAIGGALIIVAANIDKVADIGQAIIESGALNNGQPGYPGLDIGMDRKMSGYLFNKKGTEGIYEFPDETSPGKTYVGQSGNRPTRLKAHEKSGKKGPGSEATETDVAGGKTAREVAEQRRIDELGGTRDKPGSQTSNIRNPIGPARKHLMDKE